MSKKQIETLLPQIIGIVSEGDVIERVAKLLVDNGFTEQDVWREIKKINVSNVFTTNVLNSVRDFSRSGKFFGNHKDWEDSLKYDLRRLKRTH